MELRATKYVVGENGVARVTLNRPHRNNAWTGRMHTEYRWCLEQADRDPAVRVVVVTGEGKSFCVGGDSEALAGHAERGSYDSGVPEDPPNPGYGVHPYFDNDFAWHFGLTVPVIAEVNGACAGVGLVLACFCDLRFSTTTAKFATAAPKLGLPAEYGLSWLLPRMIGLTRAADLLLSGRIIKGTEAAAIGLVNHALPESELSSFVETYASNLAKHVSPNAVRTTKRQMYLDLIRHDVGSAVGDANRLLNELTGGPDYREGVRALMEKRPPVF